MIKYGSTYKHKYYRNGKEQGGVQNKQVFTLDDENYNYFQDNIDTK